MICCVWVFALGVSGIILANLDTLAEFERRQNSWGCALGETKPDRGEQKNRPLDTGIYTARYVIHWIAESVSPVTHAGCRRKIIRFVIGLNLMALLFTITGWFQ